MEAYIDFKVLWNHCSLISEAKNGFLFHFKKKQREHLQGLILTLPLNPNANNNQNPNPNKKPNPNPKPKP